jgi:hypothetical protein
MNEEEINLYPEMNERIGDILRISDEPAALYAAALIEYLKVRIVDLEAQLAESQRREKAAVADMKLSNTRKFNNPCEICRKRGEKCAPVDLQDVCRLWEWRGPQDEKGE